MTQPRTPSLLEASLPVLSLAVLLVGGFGLLGLKAEPLLLLAAALTGLLGLRLGLSWKDLEAALVEKLGASMPAILILVSVGFLVGAWMFAGTIPFLIRWGLELIHPSFLLVTAFLLSALVSTATGTSWGTVGTVGVALMGVAQGLGVPPAAAAGAAISGAYFGDKISPLSDTTNLAALSAGVDLYDHIRHLLTTTLPAAGLALLVFALAGSESAASSSSPEQVQGLIQELKQSCWMSPVLLLPLFVVLWGAWTRRPTVPVLLGSGLLALLLGLVGGGQLQHAALATVSGFTPDMLPSQAEVSPALSKLVSRGGMRSMMSTVLLLICAFSFASWLGRTGCLDRLMSSVLERTRGQRRGLALATAGSTLGTTLVTGSAYLAILLNGDLFREAYAQQGLDQRSLSRTLEDSGTVFVPLVPWSVSAAFMSEQLGVSALDYAPWAVFCYGGLIFSLLSAVTGVGLGGARGTQD